MAYRIYKNKEDYNNSNVLDDRHELLNIYSSQCEKCKHFENWDYFCAAYPNGIPNKLLDGTENHNELRSEQTGVIIFEHK